MKQSKNIFKLIILFLIALIVILSISLLIMFFNNKRYIANIDFYLKGDEIIEIEANTMWIDPLYEANYKDSSIKDLVLVDGNVDYNTPGTYKITYTIKKGLSSKSLTRKVIVKKRMDGLYIKLEGESLVYVLNGTEYIEPGYKAFCDNKDISDKVVVEGVVDTTQIGEYEIVYKINYNNYLREVSRKIIVVDFLYNIDLKDKALYVKENSIIFTTNDSNFDYVLLPDGNKNYNISIDYKITENGEYKFAIYNKYGFSVEKKFVINNIDKLIPKGTCKGYMYDKYTKLVVSATDDSGITNYEYVYGSKNSGKILSNEFEYSDYINSAFVNIYDKVNNKASITCLMEDLSTKSPSSYQSYTFTDENSRKMNYWLYIPDNLTKRSSVPLLIYLHGDGSRGSNINLVNNYAFPKFIKNGQKYPFMMLAGQISNETNWTNEGTYKRLMKLVEKIVSEYNVNPKKIMLAGGSSGGGGAYVITSQYPNYFSCTIVGSGIYSSGYKKFASNLTNTPMWIFHGTKDGIDYNSVKSYADYIISLGGNVVFKGIEGAGHNVTETEYGFNNPELINWMINQERK